MIDSILHTAKERLLNAHEEIDAGQLLSILVDALLEMEEVEELQIREFMNELCAGLEKELQHATGQKRERVLHVIDAICKSREELGK